MGVFGPRRCPLHKGSPWLPGGAWPRLRGGSRPGRAPGGSQEPGEQRAALPPRPRRDGGASERAAHGVRASEGEEIDVVTVEKRQSLSLRQPVTITLRADPLDPCMKRFHISIHQQQHNYAARSPPDACPQPEPPRQDEEEPLSTTEPTPPAGTSPGSDSEDVAKRKNHNYLERKRRNDLRSRFLALRDQVPGLASCPKTPKVVILSKSSEYLQSLISAERRMAAEKQQLRLQQSQLLRRIAHLKGH
uniref:MYCL proto-onco, bHLH transcription factor n=1 Tax=Anas platyrhynchos platyrhynchos TaxID=8840 RepID=A0A493TXV7_ANAPP